MKDDLIREQHVLQLHLLAQRLRLHVIALLDRFNLGRAVRGQQEALIQAGSDQHDKQDGF
ncbi:hypothetical protein D3C85_1799520 [compost metagenome]